MEATSGRAELRRTLPTPTSRPSPSRTAPNRWSPLGSGSGRQSSRARSVEIGAWIRSSVRVTRASAYSDSTNATSPSVKGRRRSRSERRVTVEPTSQWLAGGAAASGVESLGQVGDQVVGVFHADGVADEVVLDADLQPLLG